MALTKNKTRIVHTGTRGKVLSFTSQAATFNASLILNNQPSEVWRSTSTADQTILIDGGGISRTSAVHFNNLNLGAAVGQITYRAYSHPDRKASQLLYQATFDAVEPVWGLGDGWLGYTGLGGYSTNAFLARSKTHWLVSENAQNGAGVPIVGHLFHEITLSDPANASGYLELGTFYAGDTFEGSIDSIYGLSLDIDPNSESARTRSGAIRTNNREALRGVTVTWEHLTRQDAVSMANLLIATKLRNPVLLSIYPERSDTSELMYSIYGRIMDSQPIVTHGAAWLNGQLEELSRVGLTIVEAR